MSPARFASLTLAVYLSYHHHENILKYKYEAASPFSGSQRSSQLRDMPLDRRNLGRSLILNLQQW